MKLLRFMLSTLSVLLLLAGYLASQYEYLILRDPSGYAMRVDSPAIRNLALLLLVSAIVLSFVRDKESENV
jgi:hypothetical protein